MDSVGAMISSGYIRHFAANMRPQLLNQCRIWPFLLLYKMYISLCTPFLVTLTGARYNAEEERALQCVAEVDYYSSLSSKNKRLSIFIVLIFFLFKKVH